MAVTAEAALESDEPGGPDEPDGPDGPDGPEMMRESRSEYAFTRPVVNTYLVRERDRRLLRELAAVVLVVVCLGGGLLAYTWMHLEVLDTGYRIVDLERRLRDLSQEERRLQLEAAYLASPPHIESRAAKELGMKGPEMDQVIFSEELRAEELRTEVKPAIPPTPLAAPAATIAPAAVPPLPTTAMPAVALSPVTPPEKLLEKLPEKPQ